MTLSTVTTHIGCACFVALVCCVVVEEKQHITVRVFAPGSESGGQSSVVDVRVGKTLSA